MHDTAGHDGAVAAQSGAAIVGGGARGTMPHPLFHRLAPHPIPGILGLIDGRMVVGLPSRTASFDAASILVADPDGFGALAAADPALRPVDARLESARVHAAPILYRLQRQGWSIRLVSAALDFSTHRQLHAITVAAAIKGRGRILHVPWQDKHDFVASATTATGSPVLSGQIDLADMLEERTLFGLTPKMLQIDTDRSITPVPARPALLFAETNAGLVLFDRHGGDIIGACIDGAPVIDRHQRGHGLGTAMVAEYYARTGALPDMTVDGILPSAAIRICGRVWESLRDPAAVADKARDMNLPSPRMSASFHFKHSAFDTPKP